jgi:hypothetical protein
MIYYSCHLIFKSRWNAGTHWTTHLRSPVRVERDALGATTKRPVTGIRGQRPEGEPQQSRTGPAGRIGEKANVPDVAQGTFGNPTRRQKLVKAQLKSARTTPVKARLQSAHVSARPQGLWKTAPVQVQTAPAGSLDEKPQALAHSVALRLWTGSSQSTIPAVGSIASVIASLSL